MTAVFDYPTPRALAAYIAKQLSTGPGSAVVLKEPSSLVPHGIGHDKDVMVLDAIHPRLSSKNPSVIGDGFHVDAVPFSRWDADTTKASQRLGAKFARYLCSHLDSRPSL